MIGCRRILVTILLALPLGAVAQNAGRPNILLIVADDLGYADLGCYGGDIATPSIDRLAAEGQRFTQFHTAPSCATTRAMLLTGNNNHVAGMGRQSLPPKGSWEDGRPGYEGYLSERVAPLPELLRASGYHTYTVGKWHLGKKPEHGPAAKGFERSYNLLQGASNHFNSIGLLSSDSVSLYNADGKFVDYPKGKYSTEVYTDKLMEFIGGNRDGKPFFAYAAYTSPHWPLQVPSAFDKYKGKYELGYDELRVKRVSSLKQAGILPSGYPLPPRLESIKPWKDLSVEEKRLESRKMELYAAMVDNLDFHIGRLLEFLKKSGMYENTVIVFMSDNGASAEDFHITKPYSDFLNPRYDNSYENMGSPTSFVSYGPQWGKAGAAPFSMYKGNTTEGGIVAPMIISNMKNLRAGSIRREFITVMDIAPTILELAGASYPVEKVKPMLGESMLPYLQGKASAVHDSTYTTGLEQNGRIFFRKGKWKLVRLATQDPGSFRLFDLTKDPAETTDLAGRYPKKYSEMMDGWEKYREANGILLKPAEVPQR